LPASWPSETRTPEGRFTHRAALPLLLAGVTGGLVADCGAAVIEVFRAGLFQASPLHAAVLAVGMIGLGVSLWLIPRKDVVLDSFERLFLTRKA
jgi:hypothetical protein